MTTKLRGVDGADYYVTGHAYSNWDETVTNPNSNQTLYRKNANGRISYVEERSGTAFQAGTNYAYNRAGDLVSVTDNAGNVFSMTYDTLGRKLTMIDPDMSNCSIPANCSWKYSYNFVGSLLSQIDAKAQETDFSYDELGRLYLRHYICTFCSEDDAWFDFDGTGALGLLKDAIKGPGDLSVGGSIANSSNYSVFAYDTWGRATQVQKVIAGESQTTASGYDLLGRQTSVTYPTGEIATYVYGAEGGVHQLTFAGAPIVTSATFDALGRPTHLAWGNNLATDTVYGPRQKVQSIAVGSLLNLSYGYDPAGNALTMNETGEGWSRGFSYDWADRLTAAQEPMSGTPSKLWTYGYNALGNMTFNSDWSGAGMDGSYVYGAQGGTGPAGPHAVTKIGGTSSTYTLTYDANGSTTSETTGLGYSYNFDGKIAAVSDTGAPLNPNAAFTYDANGDRVRKIWTSAQGRLQDLRYWAGFEELRDGATLKQDRYVMLGSSRVALLPSSGTATIYYLHPDIQGTVSLVTNQSGTVVERERFAPYGGPWAQTGSTPDLRYGYTGQEHDTESGQIHLGVREFHFTIGRFLTPDGVVPVPRNPQTLNRYAYAMNNPVRYTDPSGFESAEASSCAGSDCKAPASSCSACDKIAALSAWAEYKVVDAATGAWHYVTGAGHKDVAGTGQGANSGGNRSAAQMQGVEGGTLSDDEKRQIASDQNTGEKFQKTTDEIVAKGAEEGLNATENIVATEIAGKILIAGVGAVVELKFLHAESSMSKATLNSLRRAPTEAIVKSLRPGTEAALLVKEDGTVMNGNTRLHVLLERNYPINELPREIYKP